MVYTSGLPCVGVRWVALRGWVMCVDGYVVVYVVRGAFEWSFGFCGALFGLVGLVLCNAVLRCVLVIRGWLMVLGCV